MSGQSPYQPPQETGAVDPNSREPLRRVAKYQRWVIFALLASIIINVLSLLGNMGQLPVPAVLILVAGLGVMVFSIVSIFLLAKELSGTGWGVICALLMIIPCVSLLVLLIINQKATTYLQGNGVKVGFFGTSPDNI